MAAAKGVLFMGIDIWISCNVHVSWDIFYSGFFFEWSKKIFRPLLVPRLPQNRQVRPMGWSSLPPELVHPISAAVGFYPNSWCTSAHHHVFYCVIPSLDLCLFLLSEQRQETFPLQPESPAYNGHLLNAFQMNGVVIIPLTGWLCLHEKFGNYHFVPRMQHLFG